MSENSISAEQDSWDPDEAPSIREADLDRSVYRVGFKSVEREEIPVEMMLDSGLVQFFKNRAGEQGYLALIREALMEYVQGREIEDVVRRAVREELRRSA